MNLNFISKIKIKTVFQNLKHNNCTVHCTLYSTVQCTGMLNGTFCHSKKKFTKSYFIFWTYFTFLDVKIPKVIFKNCFQFWFYKKFILHYISASCARILFLTQYLRNKENNLHLHLHLYGWGRPISHVEQEGWLRSDLLAMWSRKDGWGRPY